MFKACTGERAWKSIGLNVLCYLSRDDHDRKIWARKQRTDIGKYSFVNRTVKLWNQLPAEALATFRCKSHIFTSVKRQLHWASLLATRQRVNSPASERVATSSASADYTRLVKLANSLAVDVLSRRR